MSKTLDLNDPKEARVFLNEALPEAFKIAGIPFITHVILESGRELKFEDMNDSECVQYAFELLPIFQKAFPEQVELQYEQ